MLTEMFRRAILRSRSAGASRMGSFRCLDHGLEQLVRTDHRRTICQLRNRRHDPRGGIDSKPELRANKLAYVPSDCVHHGTPF